MFANCITFVLKEKLCSSTVDIHVDFLFEVDLFSEISEDDDDQGWYPRSDA